MRTFFPGDNDVGGRFGSILGCGIFLQSAHRAFFANKTTFLSRNVSIRNEIEFFDASVTPLACFGAGPRRIRTADMDPFDIHFRRNDPMRGFELQAGFAGRIHGRKFCIFALSVCETWLRYATRKRGLEPTLLNTNNGNLLATS